MERGRGVSHSPSVMSLGEAEGRRQDTGDAKAGRQDSNAPNANTGEWKERAQKGRVGVRRSSWTEEVGAGQTQGSREAPREHPGNGQSPKGVGLGTGYAAHTGIILADRRRLGPDEGFVKKPVRRHAK